MDSDLIRRAQDGEDQALAELLKKHYSFIVKYVWKMSGDEQLAYDVTQDVLIKAIQKINQFNHRSKFSTWLIQIATHTYLDYKRKQKKKDKLDEKLRKEFPRSSVSFPSDWHEVQEALWKLEDEHRIPLILKHYYGYDYKDIAKMTKLKVGTVKSRVHYGLENLRKELRTDDR
ncbi:RNA polymerase sigma factor SigY [Halobacillus litoralis]|uniref:RNA polymerase sigma factor SigY n=1 Tax=Halobacillus litoralis TaxID=45668 RepID=A0A845E5D0_9BACI|nr:RNA polymerase sigma factor SigY [Halobacillus litoralis]MYL50987.1 RNA polymerase sigma factor SigY [Halobacillus litoralis]